MANILPRDLPAATSVASDAALIIDDGTGVFKTTPADLVAAGGAAPRGGWADFETTTVPAIVIAVNIADTLAAGSATGTSGFLVKLDTEQTEFTALMQSYIDGSVADGTALATAQQAMRLHQKFWRRKSANNRWFTLAEEEPHMGMFGCPGDGGQSYANVMSGTDVFNGSQALDGTAVLNAQAFIDYQLYFSKRAARFNHGTHRCSRGLQMGYGRGFGPQYVQPNFTGAGQAFFGSDTFTGTTFVFDTDLDPLFNLTAYRNAYLAQFSIKGKYSKWLLDNTLVYNASLPVLDNLDPVSWIDQTARQTQNGRFNPYAGITLGAFDGAKQSPSAWATSTSVAFNDVRFVGTRLYECVLAGTTSGAGTGPTGTTTTATVTDGTAKWRYVGVYNPADTSALTSYREPYKPAWLMNPAKSAYGNVTYGSFLDLDHVTVDGCHVGLCSKPCANSSQYDYTSLNRCNFVECRYSWSIGNDQARNFSAKDCNSALVDCSITNNVHGMRVGLLNPSHFDNCSFGAAVDIFRVFASYGGGMLFTTPYCESQRRVGQLLGGGAAVTGPVFIQPNLIFPVVLPERGVAPRMLYGAAQGNELVNETSVPTNDRGAKFLGGIVVVEGVFTAFVEGTSFDGTQVYAVNRIGTVDVSQAAFHNHTAGGIILPALDYQFSDHKAVFSPKNLDTGASLNRSINTGRGYIQSDRATCIPAMVKAVRALNNDRYEELVVPHRTEVVLTMGSGNTCTFPNASDATEITINYPGATTAQADITGYGPGAAVVHGVTGTVWRVRSYDNATKNIIAVAEDNFKIVAGVKSFLFPVATTGSDLVFGAEGYYTPATPVFGDFVATVTATTNSTDTLSSVSGTLVPGQKLAGAGIPANTTVLSVSGTTAKMTAAATASAAGVTIVDGTAVANVAASNGVGTTLTTDIAVGDYLVSPPLANALALETCKTATVTNGSPGSMTLTSAALKNRTQDRLVFIQRPRPPNT